MQSGANTQVAQAAGNRAEPLRGAKTQHRLLEPWETACALPQEGLPWNCHRSKGRRVCTERDRPSKQAILDTREDWGKMELRMKGEANQVSRNSDPSSAQKIEWQITWSAPWQAVSRTNSEPLRQFLKPT